MTKTISVLVLALGGLWSGSQAMASSLCDAVAGNTVVNCGFETGDFTGWTIGGATANDGGNYYGVDGIDANSGSYGAYMSQELSDGTAPVTLSQTLTTVSGNTYTVSFWLEQDTTPDVGYAHVFGSTFGATTMLNLTPTVAVPGTVGTYTQYTYTETAAGTSTALSFSFENDDNYWSVDDVSVVSNTSATPEPSTWFLAGAALGGLLLVKRLKSRTS